MRTTIPIIPLLLVLTASLMAGPEFDRARRNTTVARANLDGAERRLNEVQAEADRIRIEMDRLRDKQRDLDRKIDRLRDIKRDVPVQVRDEEAKLPKLGDEVKAASTELAKAQEPLRGLIDKAKATLAVVKELRGKYAKQFEASDPYRLALVAAEVAAKNQAAATRGVMERVRSTPAYTAAAADHEAAKLKLAAVKRDPEAQTRERGEAASRVIATETVIARMESDALAGDESLTVAKADVRKADLALRNVIEQFERDVPKQPDMAEALAKHDAAQKAAEAADAAVTKAEARLAAANQSLALVKNNLADLKDKLAKADTDIIDAQREQDGYSRDLDTQSKRLADNVAQVAKYQRDADAAQRRYNDARAYEIVAARIDAQNEKSKDKK
jgi:chromosome segregation ATPase